MKFQGSATFLCPFGFDLVGPDSITCGPDGKWNGPVPSCKGKTKPMQSVFINRTSLRYYNYQKKIP